MNLCDDDDGAPKWRQRRRWVRYESAFFLLCRLCVPHNFIHEGVLLPHIKLRFKFEFPILG